MGTKSLRLTSDLCFKVQMIFNNFLEEMVHRSKIQKYMITYSIFSSATRFLL